MRIHSITTWMATLALALTAMSCSKSNTQTVTITFPDWQQLQAATLERQSKNSSQVAAPDEFQNVGVISVTVNGQPTKYTANGVQGVFPWSMDSHLPVPKSVTFQADKGALVQAVAIIENQGARQFFYGDATVGGGDTQTLDLYMSNAYTTGVAEGNLVGRYITKIINGEPSGPTGLFQYRFQPPGGKPSMVVTTSEMFSGWVNVTTFGSNILTFTWPDGTPVFAQSIQANDDALITPVYSKRIARLLIPESYVKREDGRVEHRGANLLTVGYFGPQADAAAASLSQSLRVCYPSVTYLGTAPAIQNLYKNYDSSTQVFSDSLIFAGALALSGNETQFSRSVYVMPNKQGGRGGWDAGECVETGSAYTNYLTIDPQRLESSDEVIGVKGPFVRGGSNNFVEAAPDVSNKVMVNWSLAPGVSADLDGFSVFWRAKPAGSDESELRLMDGYACSSFRSWGFREVSVGASAGTATIADLSYNDLSSSQIVVCPRAKDGSFYKAGAMVYSGGGFGGVQATKLQVIAADGTETTLATPKSVANGGVCFPITVRATDAGGTVGYLQSPTTLTLTSSEANVSLHMDPNCADTAMSSMTESNFSGDSRRVYVRSTDDADRDFHINVSAASGLAQPSAVYYGHQLSSLSSPMPKIKVLIPPTIYAYSCVPIEYTLVDTNSGALIGSPFDTNLWFPSLTNVTFYNANDVDCTSPITGAMLTSGVSNSVAARVKYQDTALATYDFAANISGANGITTNVSIVQPGPPARFNILTPNVYQAGICSFVKIQLVDANGRPSAPTATINGTLSASVSGVFSDSCMTVGGTSASFSISAGQTIASQGLGFTPASSVTGSFSFSIATGVNGLTTNAFPISVGLAPAYRLVLYLPGETWNPSLNQMAGAPNLLLLPLDSFQVNVLAVTMDGRVADGTNGTVAYNNASLGLELDGSSGAYAFSTGGLTQTVSITNGMGAFVIKTTALLPVSATINPNFSVSDGLLLSSASTSPISTSP